MLEFKLDDMHNGWFIGDFEPSVMKSDELEMQYYTFEDGFSERPHYYRNTTKILLVIEGKIKTYYEKEYGKNDIIVFQPGDMASIEGIGKCTVLSMKFPGNLGDRVYGITSDAMTGTDDDMDRDSANNMSDQWLDLLRYFLMLSRMKTHQIVNSAKTQEDYTKMQKDLYEDTKISSKGIVGCYDWHEEYPYETFLLYKNGDIRKPVFDDFSDKKALDFACGPGRMVKRMNKIFQKVDGCDISSRLIEEAKEYVNDSDFYVTNGNDLGDVPLNYYDYIYCTISMQHIASYQVRKQILENMYKALRPGGKIVLQMVYDPDFPYLNHLKTIDIANPGIRIKVMGKASLASWFEDHFDATSSNGGHDICIGNDDLDDIKEDLGRMSFENVAFWYSDVKNYHNDLNGKKHGKTYVKYNIYIYGEKN